MVVPSTEVLQEIVPSADSMLVDRVTSDRRTGNVSEQLGYLAIIILFLDLLTVYGQPTTRITYCMSHYKRLDIWLQ